MPDIQILYKCICINRATHLIVFAYLVNSFVAASSLGIIGIIVADVAFEMRVAVPLPRYCRRLRENAREDEGWRRRECERKECARASTDRKCVTHSAQVR